MRMASTVVALLVFALPGAAQSLSQNPYLGGIPSGQATADVLPLTLAGALDRGLKHNLGLALGEQGTRTAEAARLRALSGLLPNVAVSAGSTVQQINLAAMGFSGFPGIPQIIGPFSIVDARAHLSQQLVNLSNWYGNRAGREAAQAAQYSYQDARDIVVLAVAGLYLQAVAGQARIEAARAQFSTSEALYRRAVDMKGAGVVAGIDVLRAQVEMQAQRQRVIYDENEFEKQKLVLARAIGLPTEQRFDLTSRLQHSAMPPVSLAQAISEAYQSRGDYRSLAAQVSAAESALRAARAERYPSLAVEANYGVVGRNPSDNHGTFAASATVQIPVFRGGRTEAGILQADAGLKQKRAQLEDLRAGIQYEIRSAFLDLTAAGQQTEVARSAVDLAGQQLAQSQDRFTAGVANNLEVVQAQEALATANDNYINSLYSYNLAKASLARAIGGAEQRARQFLGAQ